MTNDDQIIVYRVIADGQVVQALTPIGFRRGGWKRFRILDGQFTGTVFNTREWYAHTTPCGAIMHEIRERARQMLAVGLDGTMRERRQRLSALADQIHQLATMAERH